MLFSVLNKFGSLFLLDEPGSVGNSSHQLGLQFMNSVISFYKISPNSTRVAVISFSSGANIEFDFRDHSGATPECH